MMKMTQLATLILATALLGACDSGEKSPLVQEYEQKVLETKAGETLDRFLAKDPMLQEFIDKSYGYAVFPKIGAGGFIVGGGHGEGVVYEQGKVVGNATITLVNVGATVGGQSFSEVLFFSDRVNMIRFKNSNVEFDATASAVAIEKGAATNVDYDKGVAIFFEGQKGLMLQASVGGQKFRFTPKH